MSLALQEDEMNASPILIGLVSAVIGLTPLQAEAQGTGSAFSNDDRVVAAIQQLPEADLKIFYLRCSHAALLQTLSAGEIGYCAYGYEELLKRVFGSDFHALLAWSQKQDTTEEAHERSAAAKPAHR
jgi:hypothetical protein